MKTLGLMLRKFVYVDTAQCWGVVNYNLILLFLNVFERKVYRIILGPVYDDEKENWRILTNKEIYASVKKPTIIKTVRLNRLYWFGYVQRMEENRISKRVLYMKLGITRLRGKPRNRWQDEVREDGRIVGGDGWQENVHN